MYAQPSGSVKPAGRGLTLVVGVQLVTRATLYWRRLIAFGEPESGGNCRPVMRSSCGVFAAHSTPYHPQTCGKVERFHQTVKRYLKAQPRARSIAQLQAQLDAFRAYYNQRRPHRALGGRTPLVAFHARIKAGPATPPSAITHFRVRHDKVDSGGRLTLRYLSVLRHIYVGRAHRGQTVRLLVAGTHVRIVREDGQLLRELTLDADRLYFGLAQPVHNVVRQVSVMS